MADDSIEVIDDLQFHPTDSPRGMHYYNMDILTNIQQKKLNKYKLKTIRNTERYLNDNPTIRALVAIIYRVVLRRQPRRNLHLTIAEYFSKPRAEIERDVKEYLRNRGPKSDEFCYINKPVGDDDFPGITKSESKIDSIIYSDYMEEDVKMIDQDKHDDELDIEHSIEHSIEQLDSRTGTETQKNVLQFQDMDETIKQISDEEMLPSNLTEAPLEGQDQRVDDSKFKEKAKKKRSKITKKTEIEAIDNTEEQWLITMTQQYAEKHKMWLKEILSTYTDPEKSRKWYVAQMINAEEQWQLFQVALQGNISPEVQDALRNWQILLIECTEDMSPEMKEAQMDWLEGQMTQGGTVSSSLIDIMRLWQTYIFLQGSVMSPAMVQNEIHKLRKEMVEAKKLSADVRDRQCAHIQLQIKKMESVVTMKVAMQDLERQWLKNQIDSLCESGFLRSKILMLSSDLLKLEKKHGLLMQPEFDAKMKVITDQLDYGDVLTYDTLIAHKKWLEWQLEDRQISQKTYEVQRELINNQLGLIGVTSSQILLEQMNWLKNEIQNNFISKAAFEEQKKLLEDRISEQNKDTIPKIEEQLRWLKKQNELENISLQKYDIEKNTLQEKITKIKYEGKTVDVLQCDLELLQNEFDNGKITDTEFHSKKKQLSERIDELNNSALEVVEEDIEALELQTKSDVLPKEYYDEEKIGLQPELDTKLPLSNIKLERANLEGQVEIVSLVKFADEIPADKQQPDILTIVSNINIPDDQNIATLQSFNKNETSAVSLYDEHKPNTSKIILQQVNEKIEEVPKIEKSPNPVTVVTINESPRNDGKASEMDSDLAANAQPSFRHGKLSHPRQNERDGTLLLMKSVVEIHSVNKKASIRQLAPLNGKLSDPKQIIDTTEQKESNTEYKKADK